LGLYLLFSIKKNNKGIFKDLKKGYKSGLDDAKIFSNKINKKNLESGSTSSSSTKKTNEIKTPFEKIKKDFDSILKKEEKIEKKSTIKFSDVAGLHNTKEEVKEFVNFLTQGEKYEKLGARIPRGALFTGPPGTGKTLLAKAIAGEAECNFYYSSGSEYQLKYVGEGAAKIRELFNKARENAPSIIFIDEIDSIGKKRDSNMNGLRDDDGILNQLLVEMDGFSTDKNVIIFAATNRSDILDSALLRSGRFDRKIEFTNPNIEERQEILKLYLKKIKIDFEEKIDDYSKKLSKITSNFSGADLANLVNEAAIISARESKKSVDSDSFGKSFDRVYFGIEQKKPNNKKELNHISYYESAKVVCSWFLENVKPIIRV
jgi:AFG3 family protein